MPVSGVYIVVCLDIKLSPAHLGDRKAYGILDSIGRINKFCFFVLRFQLLISNSLSWHCSSRDFANSSMAPGEGGLLLLFQGNTHRA